ATVDRVGRGFRDRPCASSTTKERLVSMVSGVSGTALRGRYSKISWVTCFFMTLFHIGAIWALFQFTWSGLAVLLITYYVSLALGIGMSYHRLLTHRSYKTSKAMEYFLTICATLALEGGPLFWVALHRQHHQHSDTDNDPHT